MAKGSPARPAGTPPAKQSTPYQQPGKRQTTAPVRGGGTAGTGANTKTMAPRR